MIIKEFLEANLIFNNSVKSKSSAEEILSVLLHAFRGILSHFRVLLILAAILDSSSIYMFKYIIYSNARFEYPQYLNSSSYDIQYLEILLLKKTSNLKFVLQALRSSLKIFQRELVVINDLAFLIFLYSKVFLNMQKIIISESS